MNAVARNPSGNDLSNTTSPGEDCSGICSKTAWCTHYTWTNFNGGRLYKFNKIMAALFYFIILSFGFCNTDELLKNYSQNQKNNTCENYDQVHLRFRRQGGNQLQLSPKAETPKLEQKKFNH